MSDLLAARSQMAVSLAFHILFAVAGIAMPFLMAVAEGRWLKKGDAVYRLLAERWAKGTAILFAVGAVSGTVLSFELGLLWPSFMRFAGPIIGMPFSLEGFAFFLEAIFLGIYLYGWNRVPPKIHWLAGWGVCLSGVFSGLFVVTANSWMNTPAGFTALDGKIVSIDPWKAMFNAAAPYEALHMTLAAFVAIGFAVAAIHARCLLKNPKSVFHRRALEIAFLTGAIAAILQPISGDSSARHVARVQPVKLAAMEHVQRSERGKFLSFLAYRDFQTIVVGLDSFPSEDLPPIRPVYLAFRLMIVCGFILALTGIVGLILVCLVWKKGKNWPTWFLKTLIFTGPLGLIALEAGWMVTEIGRQPWIIYNFMRTADAVTPMPYLIIPFLVFTALYFLLGTVVVILLRKLVFSEKGTSC
jgi:cytochrome d ubiquinol oxidase subunit I